MILPGILLLAIPLVSLMARDTPGETVRFSKRQLFLHPHEGCAIADLNLDGHPDIVSSPYIFWGPEFIPQVFRPNHLSTDYIRANSDHVHDVDQDGFPDIIIGGWDTEGMVWYRNPGNSAHQRGKPWEIHQPWQSGTLARTGGKMEMFGLHDYDKDGVPELHGSCWNIEEPQRIWSSVKHGRENQCWYHSSWAGKAGATDLLSGM